MPRNVRNFWVEVNVDGAKSKTALGPKAKEGGFDLTVKIRENGVISDRELVVRGYEHGGELVLWARYTDPDKVGAENDTQEIRFSTKW